jgi:hypothetical protein
MPGGPGGSRVACVIPGVLLLTDSIPGVIDRGRPGVRPRGGPRFIPAPPPGVIDRGRPLGPPRVMLRGSEPGAFGGSVKLR